MEDTTLIHVENPHEDGSRDVVIRFPLGAGQCLSLKNSALCAGGPSMIGSLTIDSGPEHVSYRWFQWRRWWHRLPFTSAPPAIPARVWIEGNFLVPSNSKDTP